MAIFLATTAAGQAIPPSEQPGKERGRFTEPTAPRAQPATPSITLPSTVAPAGAATTKLTIRDIQVAGSTVYSADALRPFYQDLLGKETTLQAVYDVARKITARYGNDGYVLSRAIVPPQKLDAKAAVLRIEVIEGYVDHVQWSDKVGQYQDLFTGYEKRIMAERPANIRTIERELLLAGDLPGLKFTASLKPSATNSGASTLVIDVAEKHLDALLRIDNRGTKARGPEEYLLSATENNLFGWNESITATWAATFQTNELKYGALDYKQVITSSGLTFFADASYGWGKPGTAELQTLDYKPTSLNVDAGLSYPVIRARERNLTLSALAFISNSRSDILGIKFNEDRLRGFRLIADADASDRWKGINKLNVQFSHGIDGLGSTKNGNALASRAAGKVDFSKIEATVSRIQTLVGNLSAVISAYGQFAFTPLLSPEQCDFGGRNYGRGFDPSELSGDHCVEVSGELRYDIPLKAVPVILQPYGFIDYGEVFNKKPATGTPRSADAASTGLGLRLGYLTYLSADLTAAKDFEGPRNDWRLFFAVTARY